MKRKVWFYLCIIQAAILLTLTFLVAWPSLTISEPQSVNLKDYTDQFSEENNYLPDVGYIPDAATAKVIGSKIIDNLTGNKLFGAATVKYDKDNRLWLIEKGYLFGHGGFVIIEQDSGKVIKALLTK